MGRHSIETKKKNTGIKTKTKTRQRQNKDKDKDKDKGTKTKTKTNARAKTKEKGQGQGKGRQEKARQDGTILVSCLVVSLSLSSTFSDSTLCFSSPACHSLAVDRVATLRVQLRV